jgi:Protein of unknown function (DUF1475)
MSLLLFRGLLVAMLFCILAFTVNACMQQAIWLVPASVAANVWFKATLCDTYLAFLFFWLWLAYREATWGKRLLWLFLIAGLGNIAMTLYVLVLTVTLQDNTPEGKATWPLRLLLGRHFNKTYN